MAEWDHDQIADLTAELRALLWEWDPVGYVELGEDDRVYDGLNGFILARMVDGDDLATFSERFAHAARFCGDRQFCDRFAATLYNWFHSKDPATYSQDEPRPQLRKGRRWRSSHWNR